MTLIQTGKIADFPVVLIGTVYWRPLQDLLGRLAVERTIDAEDLELLKVTDDVGEALDHVQRHAMERFRLRPRPFKASSLLGEPRTLESAVTVDVMPSSDSRFGRGVAGS